MMNLIRTAVLAIIWASSPSAFASPDTTEPDPAPSFAELVDTAAEASLQSDHSESARLYIDAYHALPMNKRIGGRGKLMVEKAIEEARLGQEQEVKDPHVLEDVLALVEEFIADQQAIEKEVPPQILEDRAWLEGQLHSDEADDTTPEHPIEPTPLVEQEEQQDFLPPGPASTTNPTQRKRRLSPTTLGWMVTGAGLASIAGGGVLIGFGSYNRGRLQQTTTDFEASGKNDDDIRNFNKFNGDWKPLMISQIVIGPILTVAGIALTTWGARSLQRHRHPKRYATTLAPRVSPREASLNLSLTF